MLICKVNNMMIFVSWTIMTSYRKKTYNVCFLTQFSHYSKIKNLMLFILIATTLSPLGLIFFNSMSALLAIKYFPIISYLFLLDDSFKSENKDFWVFTFLWIFNSVSLHNIKRIQFLLYKSLKPRGFKVY
jgi:hypothetical protein